VDRVILEADGIPSASSPRLRSGHAFGEAKQAGQARSWSSRLLVRCSFKGCLKYTAKVWGAR
jgi:hypothetical protein